MIEISIVRDSDDYLGFTSSGHAMYDDYGHDIVCAGVSTLVINTINSIDKFTDSDVNVNSSEEDGYIDCKIIKPCVDSNLLMKSLILGLEGIRDSYSENYLQIIIKEV